MPQPGVEGRLGRGPRIDHRGSTWRLDVVDDPRFIAAGPRKQTTGVGGDNARAYFGNTELRLVPVFILPEGWAITGELRQTWEHRTDFKWQRAELTLNKQFNLNGAGSVSTSRDFSDRRDGGGASMALKCFF
jgi:hypothetical protein